MTFSQLDLATREAEERSKEQFFRKLQALKDSSDTDDDTNDFKEVLARSRKKHQPPPIKATPEKPSNITKVPGIHRTTSAPVSSTSFVKETPPVSRKSTLHQVEILTPSSVEVSVVEETQLQPTPSGTPRPGTKRRTVSDPTIGAGFLKLKHSVGIESMLGRKRAGKGGTDTMPPKKKSRKSDEIKLVDETKRIFHNMSFYWIPPDEKCPLRKKRLRRARELGGTWNRELTPETTHIIVESYLTYEQVMEFLKLEKPPDGIVMVYDRYMVDCISSLFLFDHCQAQYEVYKPVEQNEIVDSIVDDQPSNTSLQVKGVQTAKGRGLSPSETSPRSQEIISEDPSQQVAPGQPAEGANYGDHQSHQSSPEVTFVSPFFGDEFDEIIKQARELKNMHMDEDDENHRPSSRDEPDQSESDSDSHRGPLRAGVKATLNQAGKPGAFNQQNFSCMKGGTGNSADSSPNRQVIEILQQMCDHYGRMRDQWRHRSYQKAIGLLKKLTYKVCTYEDAIALPGIGDRLAKKIEEIMFKGCLKRLEYAQQEPDDVTLQLFLKIYGVGYSQGWKWVQQGYRTLDDLTTKAKLTENQRIGIERYEDLNTRIPRAEVTALGEIVKSATALIDPLVRVIIGGSYRRGSKDSGDIDCLLTKPQTTRESDLLPFLRRLIAHLTSSGFLVCALAVPSDTGSKWHGCCILPPNDSSSSPPPPVWRRIDFLLVPETQFGAALIYFTGDDIFNRSIRLLASKKGWRLNQRELYRDMMRGPGSVKMTEGLLIEGADEKKIFEKLGVPYRKPEHRICS